MPMESPSGLTPRALAKRADKSASSMSNEAQTDRDAVKALWGPSAFQFGDAPGYFPRIGGFLRVGVCIDGR
jgi:hypothetical protein